MRYEIKTYKCICDHCGGRTEVKVGDGGIILPEGWTIRTAGGGWNGQVRLDLCQKCSIFFQQKDLEVREK